MIDGPTPARLVEAPSAGTGKGLLTHALVLPALGNTLAVMPPASTDDEWRKRITAALREAPGAILIDNVTRALDSAALSAVLTARVWSDRLLGHSTTVNLPVRCLWLMAGNNPTMTTEIARRMVRIRMDARVDRPWQRSAKDFRHPKLLEWAEQSRSNLVWAALVLVRHWLAAGRPLGTKTLGSYERWAAVMGGILRAAGIPGFLGNLDALYDEADTEGAMWRELVDAWWDKYRDGEVGVADLFTLAQASERFDFGRATTERGQKTAFGMALSKQRDRIIGRYQVQRTGTQRRAAMWRLAEVRQRVNLENQRDPLAAQSEMQGQQDNTSNSNGGEKVHVGSQGSHGGTAGACLACDEGTGVDGPLCADCAAELEAATPSGGLFAVDMEPLP
jgi:hypothetical protein